VTAATISLPTTRCAKLLRKWARDVAIEVRDAIRERNAGYGSHVLWVNGDEVHYEPSGSDAPVGWKLVGVYDVAASISDIADDIELVASREPMHASA